MLGAQCAMGKSDKLVLVCNTVPGIHPGTRLNVWKYSKITHQDTHRGTEDTETQFSAMPKNHVCYSKQLAP